MTSVNIKNPYIEKFIDKIHSFSDHEKYSWLEKYAQDAIYYFDETGPMLIKAEDFIERILKMDEEFIRMWLDGKHLLKWDEWHIWKNRKATYDPHTLCRLFRVSDYDALSYLYQFCIGEQRDLVLELMGTNDFYYSRDEEPPVTERDYHDKKWTLFCQFQVRKNQNGDMEPLAA